MMKSVDNKEFEKKTLFSFKKKSAMGTFLLSKGRHLLWEFISKPHEAQKTTFKSVFHPQFQIKNA